MSGHATSFSLVWLKAANMAVANEQQWALEAVKKLSPTWPEVEGNRLSDCLFHLLQSDLQLCWSDRMLLCKAKTMLAALRAPSPHEMPEYDSHEEDLIFDTDSFQFRWKCVSASRAIIIMPLYVVTRFADCDK